MISPGVSSCALVCPVLSCSVLRCPHVSWCLHPVETSSYCATLSVSLLWSDPDTEEHWNSWEVILNCEFQIPVSHCKYNNIITFSCSPVTDRQFMAPPMLARLWVCHIQLCSADIGASSLSCWLCAWKWLVSQAYTTWRHRKRHAQPILQGSSRYNMCIRASKSWRRGDAHLRNFLENLCKICTFERKTDKTSIPLRNIFS